MKVYMGIWLDRRKAIVATIHQPEFFDDTTPQTEIAVMDSGVAKRVRTAGGSRTGNAPWGPQQTVSESSAEARHQNQLKQFSHRLVKVIAPAHRILFMGPGETKHGVMKVLEADSAIAARIAEVETCDKMTPAQIDARVVNYFQLKRKTETAPNIGN